MTCSVIGDGIAAACCRLLLSRSGIACDFKPNSRRHVPAILISQGTRQLLEEVSGNRQLLQGFRAIRRRVVQWGARSAVTLAHEGWVAPEGELLARLRDDGASLEHDADWTIHTAELPGELSSFKHFGERTASAFIVKLAAGADREACFTESTESGWLFLLPFGNDDAVLLTAGETSLDESRLIKPVIGEVLKQAGSFPAHPRIAHPLCGKHWLACGSAALGFDPLCGDGSGHAVREAILASAIVAEQDSSSEELLWEFRLRLWRGFRRHLELCLQYYRTGGSGGWWQQQCESLAEGMAWLDSRPSSYSLGTFQLNGFKLQRAVARAAMAD